MSETPAEKQHGTMTGLRLDMNPVTEDGGHAVNFLAGGPEPGILIRLGLEGESVVIDINSTGPATPEELSELLDMVMHALRHATEDKTKTEWDLNDCEPSNCSRVKDQYGIAWRRNEHGLWVSGGAMDSIGIGWSEMVRRHGPVEKAGE